MHNESEYKEEKHISENDFTFNHSVQTVRSPSKVFGWTHGALGKEVCHMLIFVFSLSRKKRAESAFPKKFIPFC